MIPGNKSNKGFTLVEVLVSLAILGIIIVPIMGLFTAVSMSSQKTIRNTVALTVARDIMDRIKTGDINAANADSEAAAYKSLHGVEIYVPSPEAVPGNGLKLITVFVTPESGMDPRTEGIMLGSYSTNVILTEIDTTQMCYPEPGQDYGGISSEN